MSRRPILLILAGLAAGALGSRLVRAADPAQRVVRLGIVSPDTPATEPPRFIVFWERLRGLGWIESQNLIVERRWAAGRYTRTIPIVAPSMTNPVRDGLVTRLLAREHGMSFAEHR